MASKEEMQDARKAKAAAANKKLEKMFAERNAKVPGVKKAVKAKSAFREKSVKEASKYYEYKGKAKGSAKAGTLSPKAASNAVSKINRAKIKADYPKDTPKSVSAKKPSMPVKTGAKNKMKAQGAKSRSGPTSGYNKTKPRGK
jgi:hypothetical protein